MQPEESEGPGPVSIESDLATLDQVGVDLDAVEACLQALDRGSYGLCAHCSQPIPDHLLAADPLVSACEAHAATA